MMSIHSAKGTGSKLPRPLARACTVGRTRLGVGMLRSYNAVCGRPLSARPLPQPLAALFDKP